MPKQITADIEELVFKEDFIKHFQILLDFVKKMEVKNNERMDEIANKLGVLSEEVKSDAGNELLSTKQQAIKYCEAEMGRITKEHNGLVASLESKLSELKEDVRPDSSSLALEASAIACEQVRSLIPTVEQIENDIPKLGTQIRNALELLEGDEKTHWTAIDGVVGIHVGATPPSDKKMLWIKT